MLKINRIGAPVEGRPVCQIVGGNFEGTIISIDANATATDEEQNLFADVGIPEEDEGKFQQLPNPNTEREILYITGASGSGKSTYATNYLKHYNLLYPSRKIFVFSALPSDDGFKGVKNMFYVKMNEEYLKKPPRMEELTKSLVIFDDIDVLSEPFRSATFDILNKVLEIGRHYFISAILTMHLATNGKDTRRILNECHSVTVFPFSGMARNLNYLLVEYIGLDNDTLTKLKATKSRWATVFKNYPMAIMTERNVTMASEF